MNAQLVGATGLRGEPHAGQRQQRPVFNRALQALKHPIAELWRHPIHTREFGSHVTNVLRCLQLEAHGYDVTVTELVGWEHSMKNELIIARFQPDRPRQRAGERLTELLHTLGLETLSTRFFTD